MHALHVKIVGDMEGEARGAGGLPVLYCTVLGMYFIHVGNMATARSLHADVLGPCMP